MPSRTPGSPDSAQPLTALPCPTIKSACFCITAARAASRAKASPQRAATQSGESPRSTSAHVPAACGPRPESASAGVRGRLGWTHLALVPGAPVQLAVDVALGRRRPGSNVPGIVDARPTYVNDAYRQFVDDVG